MAERLPSFWIKAALAVGLVAVADRLLYDHEPGVNLAVFGLSCVAALAIANPAVRTHGMAIAAVALAAAFATLQLERPTLVGLAMFTAALAVAALAPRARTGEDAWAWCLRLAVAGLKSLAGPYLDGRRILTVRARRKRLVLTAVLAAAILPVGGGLLFLWLFGLANPVIGDFFTALRLPEPDIGRIIFGGMVAGAAWAVLRPRGRRWRSPKCKARADWPSVTTASVAVSLVVFNLLFALQNGLDIAFLWSGARLPDGMSFAEYAHRGAYPLIATALLAGLFVVVFLRPGTPTAESRPVRALVIAWVAQNIFLVASTALRTIDYIDAYSLTRMRIAALLWMALVALGLALICWRLVRGRSASWLINTNVAAAAVALTLCSVIDLGAVAAAWNIRHAREVGGRGAELDLCYLRDLDGAAVVSLAELERRPLTPELRDRVAFVRRTEVADMTRRQADGLGWRWRDARRLARVRALTGEAPARPPSLGRECDGTLKPLTPTPQPRT
ncbi:MAG: DUF4173 domain-containing protein [Phenylobacterium sp.]